MDNLQGCGFSACGEIQLSDGELLLSRVDNVEVSPFLETTNKRFAIFENSNCCVLTITSSRFAFNYADAKGTYIGCHVLLSSVQNIRDCGFLFLESKRYVV